MSQLKKFLAKLNEIISLEDNEPIERLGGYIGGELLGDYEDEYAGLYGSNAKVQKIGDLASDLKYIIESRISYKKCGMRLRALRVSLRMDNKFLEQLYETIILPRYKGQVRSSNLKWIDHGRVGLDTWAHYFESNGKEYVLLNEDSPGGEYLNDHLSHLAKTTRILYKRYAGC